MVEIETFGERLRRLRLKQKLGAGELARAANISPASVSRYESEQRLPSWESIERLSRVLRVTPQTLMGGNDHAQ